MWIPEDSKVIPRHVNDTRPAVITSHTCNMRNINAHLLNIWKDSKSIHPLFIKLLFYYIIVITCWNMFCWTPWIPLWMSWTSVHKEFLHICDEILCLHLSYWYVNVHHLYRLNGIHVLQEVCQVVMKAFAETVFSPKIYLLILQI